MNEFRDEMTDLADVARLPATADVKKPVTPTHRPASFYTDLSVLSCHDGDCNSKPLKVRSDSMAGANREIVRAFYEAVRRGELSRAVEVFAEDLTWVEPPFPGHEGGTFQGRTNVVANVLTPFLATWTDLTVTPERIIDAGADVVVLGRYGGKHRESGRRFEARFVHTWTFRGEKAARFEMLADTVQFFRTVTKRPDSPQAPAMPVSCRSVNVGGVRIFYREAGPHGAPVLLLLHGFPTSSHMFRNLIPLLAYRFHVVAPDLPGFGFSDAPDRKQFAYKFDNLAKVIEGFTEAVGLTRYALYVFDYGAPVGFRLALARPDRVAAIVSQNGNAYEEGLSQGWNPIQKYWREPTAENRRALRDFLAPDATKWQYVHGVLDETLVPPESYTLDSALLARSGNDEIQLDLFLDYASNVALYPKFQEYIAAKRPPLLAVWGKHDPFFLPAGADAFRRDNPAAEIHFFDTGHFALETHAPEIANLIRRFLEDVMSPPHPENK
jgi:pimeloyl-ACP methyl ester carboxylesterase/ketosteroid isomerase-like protein